jgi:hypothetical protein
MVPHICPVLADVGALLKKRGLLKQNYRFALSKTG